MPRSRREDDDYDDRPLRRRRRDDDDHDPGRRSGGGGLPIGLIVGGGVGVVLLAVGLLVFLLVGRKGPQPEVAANGAEQVPAAGVGPRPFPVPAFGGDGAVNPFPAPAPKKEGAGKSMPAGTPTVRQIVFAGGTDGVVGLMSYKPVGTGEVLTVARTKTGEKLGAVEIDLKDSGNGYAVAPGGRFAAAKGSAPFEGDPLILFDLPSGKSFRFTPYARSPATITNPNVIGFAFPAPDRLLTVTDRSGFDVWKLPQLERVGGQPSRPSGSIPFVGTTGVAHSPANYGLSADGKTFAVFDGTGFSFFDAATAAGKAKTEPLIQPNGSMNFWGAAFSADGSKFACLCSVYAPKEATALVVWEPATGKRVSLTPLVAEKSGAGIGWWGPNHVLLWQGGQAEAKVLSVQNGTVVAQVQMALTTGRLIAPATPGDMLWYSYEGSGLAGGAAPMLVSVPAPPTMPTSILELGPDGPRWK